jgi:cell division protein FtsB
MKRLVLLVGGLCAAAFAVQGGEYGTTDLVKQRARKQRLEASIDSLQQQVDSLDRWKRSLASDPAVQERIAREEFGMVRGEKELLYRFSDAPPGEDRDRRR